jgi:hypothetical protein
MVGFLMASLLIFGFIGTYLAPTAIAAYRDHIDKNAIFLVNLLLGWTVIGWVVALVWSGAGPAGKQPIATQGDEWRAGRLRLQGRDPRGDP